MCHQREVLFANKFGQDPNASCAKESACTWYITNCDYDRKRSKKRWHDVSTLWTVFRTWRQWRPTKVERHELVCLQYEIQRDPFSQSVSVRRCAIHVALPAMWPLAAPSVGKQEVLCSPWLCSTSLEPETKGPVRVRQRCTLLSEFNFAILQNAPSTRNCF